MTRPDVIVVGLGVVGASICRALVKRGARVLGIDALAPPHDRGSSHGRTRVIREAYFEHPLYVPLVQRAYELWAELEREREAQLFHQTGALMIGPEDGVVVRGTLASARAHGLGHELLDASALRRRFPALRPEPDHVAVHELRAGILFAEPCVTALHASARALGASLRTGVRVTAWQVGADGTVTLDTSDGVLSAPRVVFAAGPWLRELVAAEASALELPLAVERQVTHWFGAAPDEPAFTSDVCPVAIWEYERDRFVYTLPDVGDGMKAALHYQGETVDPDDVDRNVRSGEVAAVQSIVNRLMPGAAHTSMHSSVCLYTNTPDHHFLVDRHPAYSQVHIVSACSGHGFKFAPAIGEATAEFVLGESGGELGAFALDRKLRGMWS